MAADYICEHCLTRSARHWRWPARRPACPRCGSNALVSVRTRRGRRLQERAAALDRERIFTRIRDETPPS